ncbi:MAG: hypothetical protein A2X12_04030 [Bacteroidetes bacterium GWE2_29_8]|nr:MAG: hypothetical protein A2X12_04030 [Bacteroidetes bacterium GWE2_29_8]OFY13771.1 MAG: hypothetical protein A2X02_00610 [Bacteroidetes bacterium GWF2_29_10]
MDNNDNDNKKKEEEEDNIEEECFLFNKTIDASPIKNLKFNDNTINIESNYIRTHCHKAHSFDWLTEITDLIKDKSNMVEIAFKNGRKEYFLLQNELKIKVGDIVLVEANPGYDIGIVKLIGEATKLQMRKKNIKISEYEIKRVIRKCRQPEIDKWKNVMDLEFPAIYKSRELARKLNLSMKITDVEYQADRSKAIFYYTADDRVDFRELVKILAEQFSIRIEMRQCGMRQDAGRLGGLGSCGRELCCASWMSKFHSVSTNNARVQQLSLNPQKLGGLCSKLKCCLNFEYDNYLEASGKFPDNSIVLKTKKGNAVFLNNDVFREISWYAYDNEYNKMIPLSLRRINEIIEMNKNKIFPDDLLEVDKNVEEEKPDYQNIVGVESTARFDKKDNFKNKKKRK